MFSPPQKPLHVQNIILHLLLIESTTSQTANYIHHAISECTVKKNAQPLYIELTYFISEVVQLYHLLSNLSYPVLCLEFWRNVYADLCRVKEALDLALTNIYLGGKINVGTLRREEDAFIRAHYAVKAVRRSLQTVYIVICNSVYSAAPEYESQQPAHQVQLLNPRYPKSQPQVYIVHAGEDKVPIALPLWKQLRANGIHSFLDREEMQVGDDKEQVLRRAMDAAQICVIITSPELVAKRWPMLEVDHFLRRSRREGAHGPLILPVFYRLCIRECHGYEYFGCQDREGRNLFIKWGFFERLMSGETSFETAVECMKELTGKVGLENDEEASNEDTAEMEKRRVQLINRVVGAVVALVHRRNGEQS